VEYLKVYSPYIEREDVANALNEFEDNLPASLRRDILNRITGFTHKECSACHRILPKEAYHVDRRNKSGLYSQCKECRLKERATDDA